jgi:hypothetical protein
MPWNISTDTTHADARMKLLNRHRAMNQLMGWDWKTRRRVGKSLRRGCAIPAEDQEVAHSIIAVWERRSWLVWSYLIFGVCWLFSAIAMHGFARWFDLALSLSYLASAPYWFHVRRQILRNGASGASVPGRAA